jgi:hypothetical protein
MVRRALSIEEKKLRKRERNQRLFSNPEALKRKREIDRVRKQERRQQNLSQVENPAEPLVEPVTQEEPFDGFAFDESDGGFTSGYIIPEESEEETGVFEPEDGLVLRGISQSPLAEEIQGIKYLIIKTNCRNSSQSRRIYCKQTWTRKNCN